MEHESDVFPAYSDYRFKKRMYKIRISKLDGRILALENQERLLTEQNEYYQNIITEKNNLINQLRSVINCLEKLLVETVEVFNNETDNAKVPKG